MPRCSACAAPSIRSASQIPASSSRRRGCAARCRARTARILSRGRALQTASSDGILEHEPGDLTCIVEGASPALGAPRRARPARPAPLARPTGRPDGRRVPARGSVRPARAPVRDDARSRDRRDGGAPGRDESELRRQGREERRGVRPREALLRLARAARIRRASRPAPAPAARGGSHDCRRRGLAHAPPLAARAERGRHRGRPHARALRGIAAGC